MLFVLSNRRESKRSDLHYSVIRERDLPDLFTWSSTRFRHSCISLMNPIKLKGCQDALGMESRKISDDQITASLYTNLDHAPYRARLYNQESAIAWTTPVGSHWLQIDLRDRSIRITRVATQGRYSYDQWVTMYQLQYGDDGVTFQYYRDKQAVIKVKYICSLKLTFFPFKPSAEVIQSAR